MLILAPMHPVLLVYDLDDTEGKELPEELNKFAKYEGDIDSRNLEKLINNSKRYGIRIEFKRHSSVSAGFAAADKKQEHSKIRISIHDGLDESSRVGTLCHELAHVFLGHLGSDEEEWWPCREDLSHSTVEIEAESVAYIVTQRIGLSGSSDTYLSHYLEGNKIPEDISIDLITKVAKKIEEMIFKNVKAPKKKNESTKKVG